MELIQGALAGRGLAALERDVANNGQSLPMVYRQLATQSRHSHRISAPAKQLKKF